MRSLLAIGGTLVRSIDCQDPTDLLYLKRGYPLNGLRIGGGGAFENVSLIFAQIPDRITYVEFITVNPAIATKV